VDDWYGMVLTASRCYWINVASLICGFMGNLFLLLNFTQRIRYIIALPATIVFWYLSSGFLIAITACMDIYVPPNRPYEGWYVSGEFIKSLANICTVSRALGLITFESFLTFLHRYTGLLVCYCGCHTLYRMLHGSHGQYAWLLPRPLPQ
jgi:hypothetical protein